MAAAVCTYGLGLSEEVERFLSDSGFDDVCIESKGRRRDGVTWTFRASRSDGKELVQPTLADFEGDVLELTMTKEAKRQAPYKSMAALPQERRVVYRGARNSQATRQPHVEGEARGLEP